MKKYVIKNYAVESKKLSSQWNGYRIVMISDYHTNEYGIDDGRLIRDIKKTAPDCIILAGDIMTASVGQDNSKACEFIRNISEISKIYMGLGNHEYRSMINREKYGTLYDEFEKVLKECHVTVLKNEQVRIEQQGEHISLYGLMIDKRFYHKFKRYAMEEDYMEKELGKASEDYNIVIAHNPVYFKDYAAWGADLVLSGHVHGGMAKIPGIGGIVAPNYRIFPEYDSGIFRCGESTMVLSAGLGTHTINVRPFNPCELIVIELMSLQ